MIKPFTYRNHEIRVPKSTKSKVAPGSNQTSVTQVYWQGMNVYESRFPAGNKAAMLAALRRCKAIVDQRAATAAERQPCFA